MVCLVLKVIMYSYIHNASQSVFDLVIAVLIRNTSHDF